MTAAAAAERVGVLLGGESPEREVSLASGEGVVRALRNLGLTPVAVDPAANSDWLAVLAGAEVRRVFNILHGGTGENGEVRGALACARMACTGSGVLGSALAMNKAMTKRIWRAAGIPTADWRVAAAPREAAAVAAALPPPWFVKPVCGGSSTHAGAARDEAALAAAIAVANREGGGALVEALVTGEEYTMGVVGEAALPLVRIAPAAPFYDYHAKYVARDTGFFCPCGLDAAREEALAALAMRAYQALGCAGWGRVDFLLTAEGAPMFLEVNTVPGMTSHSLLPLAGRAAGWEYDEVVRRILATAEEGR